MILTGISAYGVEGYFLLPTDRETEPQVAEYIAPWSEVAYVGEAEWIADGGPNAGALAVQTGSAARAAGDAEESARQEKQAGGVCTIPPPGWTCSRRKGHDGPCAASPVARLFAGGRPSEHTYTSEQTGEESS